MKWKVTLIVLVGANECLKACVTVCAEESHRVLGGRRKGQCLYKVVEAMKFSVGKERKTIAIRGAFRRHGEVFLQS